MALLRTSVLLPIAGLACGRLRFEASRDAAGDGLTDAPGCAGIAGLRYDEVGTGTAADPYRLCTATQWMDLAGRPAGWGLAFSLAADLDLGAIAGDHPPIGTMAMPFTGSLDGGGKIVSGYRNQSGASYLGLFGYVDGGASIHDLGVRDADVLSYEMSGCVIGYLAAGTVTRVASFGPSCYVRSNGYANHKGGLIGETTASATVVDVFSTCRVGGTGNGVGGLIGHNDGHVTNGYYAHTADPVTGTGKVGSLIGWNFTDAAVASTFAIASVDGNEAGDVGLNLGLESGMDANTFYDATGMVTNPAGGTVTNGVAIDTAAMPGYFFLAANPPMTSWDFAGTWEVRPNDTPILQFLHGTL